MGELVDLTVRPGVVTDETARGAEPYWKGCDHVRFRNGLPEKIGGWKAVRNQSGALVQVRGLTRALHDWSSLDGETWVAVGTHLKLYLINRTTVYDITPLRDSGTIHNPFTTLKGSAVVTVSHESHGVQPDGFVHFAEANVVGGLRISGEYQVVEVVDVDRYRITADQPAASSRAGGGDVGYQYEIPVGFGSRKTLYGYGVAGYGRGTYGTPRKTSTYFAPLRVWSLDNWGEDLIASPLDGPVFHWDRSTGPNSRAVRIESAPVTNKRIMVSPEDRHLIAFGAHDTVSDDAMLVRWSSQENFNDWIPSETDTSGDKRLDAGSRIVTAIKARGEKVIFTDEALYSMQFVGGRDVFGFYPLTRSVRIASPNAAVEVNGLVMFMAARDFFVYDGTLNPLPCPIRNHVFGDINERQLFKVYGFVNQLFGEVWWSYPSAGSEENDRYAVYNYNERVWYFGTLNRTAMHDQSVMFGLPYGVDDQGVLYRHEDGKNDDTQPLAAWLESYGMEIMDGRRLAHISRLIPDFLSMEGSVEVYLKTRQYPQDDKQVVKGPYRVTARTRKVSVRARNRQVALRIECDAINDSWRMSTWRAEVRPHGRR